MNVPKIDLLRIVIIGAGFSGLKIAKLVNTRHSQVVIIDKQNYHTFQPCPVKLNKIRNFRAPKTALRLHDKNRILKL